MKIFLVHSESSLTPTLIDSKDPYTIKAQKRRKEIK